MKKWIESREEISLELGKGRKGKGFKNFLFRMKKKCQLCRMEPSSKEPILLLSVIPAL